MLTHLKTHLRNTCYFDPTVQNIFITGDIVDCSNTIDGVEVVHSALGELELVSATDGFFNAGVCMG